MSLILFILFGFIVGLLARAIMPGNQKMGFVMTTLLGVVGSFLGGFISSLVTDRRVTDLHTAGIIGSVIGAIIVLAVAGGVFSRRAFA
jgi:uncharacterized membrane protein YeaQ/YmgE (transglycosylase-associated protein family)